MRTPNHTIDKSMLDRATEGLGPVYIPDWSPSGGGYQCLAISFRGMAEVALFLTRLGIAVQDSSTTNDYVLGMVANAFFPTVPDGESHVLIAFDGWGLRK